MGDLKRIFGGKVVKAVVAGIITKSSKIFLTRRTKIIPEGGKWCLPGGHIEIGETAEKALNREVDEETNLRVNKSKFLFYYDEIIPEKKISNVMLVFQLEASGEAKKNIEVSEFKWFTQEEIEKLDMAFKHKKILEKFFMKDF